MDPPAPSSFSLPFLASRAPAALVAGSGDNPGHLLQHLHVVVHGGIGVEHNDPLELGENSGQSLGRRLLDVIIQLFLGGIGDGLGDLLFVGDGEIKGASPLALL